MGFIPARMESWARANSIWYYVVSTGCCADEVRSLKGGRYDIERFGCMEVGDPAQADLLIVQGFMNQQASAALKDIYDQMASPKYVIVVGACACSGKFFGAQESRGLSISDVIPVNLYVPGCPPRPESIMHGILELQKNIEEVKDL